MSENKNEEKPSTINKGLETMHKYLGKAATETIAGVDTAYYGELDSETIVTPPAPRKKK